MEGPWTKKGNAQTLAFSIFFSLLPNDRRAGVSEGQVLRTDCSTVFFDSLVDMDGAGWYGIVQHANVLSPHAPVCRVEVARLAIGLCLLEKQS